MFVTLAVNNWSCESLTSGAVERIWWVIISSSLDAFVALVPSNKPFSSALLDT